jgi:hypothetical protein
MQPASTHYPDWTAPSEDGQVVIWPQPRELIDQTLENQKLLGGAQVRIQQLPLAEVRRRTREFIGHADHAALLFMTGHQTELYHAGVWAKNAMIDALATRLGGRAVQLAVDSDGPKHLNLRWPPTASIPISDDANLSRAAWSGLLASPTPAHLQQIQSRLAADSATWQFKSMLPELLSSLRRLSMESQPLPATLSNAMHELDWSLGLRHHVLLASPLWECEPFMVFVHDLLANAGEFGSHYNRALAEYRAANGIRSAMRPMPDLTLSVDAIEAPFWLDDLKAGRRLRPTVFRREDQWVLPLLSGEEFIFDQNADGWEAAANLRKWLNSTRHRLSPRALTTTMFIRLMIADQLVHGIGGARYDQVTDSLIQSHYQMPAPRFSVTTATLYFPEAVGRDRVCLACVKQQGHRLKHDALGAKKRELVAQIDALPRRSAQRAARFFDMHSELNGAIARSDAVRRWQEEFKDSQERERQELTLFDRELFYAIQPKERLMGLIERYRRITTGIS